MASYALHRGYFAKKYPQTSLKGIYFLPSIFIIGLMLGGIISLYSVFFRMAYFLGLSVYLLLTLIFSFSRELRLIPFIFSGIILSHLAYGLYFLKGLLSRRLKEEL
jgi:hypothetical protein